MNTFFYTLTLTSSVLIIIVLYIYYRFSDNKYTFDFLIINILSFFSLVFLIQTERTAPETYTIFDPLEMTTNIISTIFTAILIYEYLFQKRSPKKYRYLTPSSLAIIIFSFFNQLNTGLILNIRDFSHIIIFLEVAVIFVFYINRIDAHFKAQILKFLIIVILYLPVAGLIEFVSKSSSDMISSFIYDSIFCGYFIYLILKKANKSRLSQSKDASEKFTLIKSKFGQYGITNREKEITILVLKGKSNQEIANELQISINTVKIHIYNIFRKFNIKKRADIFNIK